MKASEPSILAAWSRLGVAWNIPACRCTPDVESLIVDSLVFIPGNSRLLILMASWLFVYWRCVGRDRLLALATRTTRREQATLGIVLETVDSWLSEPVFPAVRRTLQHMQPPQPLLAADCRQPSLARLAQREASEESRHWGLWCLPFHCKLDAIRPRQWVIRMNPPLHNRAFFKGNLRTSLLAAIHAGGPDIPTTQLARQCQVTRKAVYQALDDLRFCGLLLDSPGNSQTARSALGAISSSAA